MGRFACIISLGALLLLIAAADATSTPNTFDALAESVPASWVDEAFEWFRSLLQINSSIDPTPDNTNGVARFLQGVLLANGITPVLFNQTYMGYTAPAVIARLPGTGSGSILMASHSDTVSGWTMGADAFSARITADGNVIGRGAMDMKHKIAQDLATLIWTKRLGLAHERALVFAVFPGEEIGLQGATVCKNDARCFGLISDAVLAFEEIAGFTVTAGDGTVLMPVAIGDKGPCPVTMSTKGAARHHCSYATQGESAAFTMANAVLTLNEEIPPPHYTAVNRALLADLIATGKPYLIRIALGLSNELTFRLTMERLRDNDLSLFKVLYHQFCNIHGFLQMLCVKSTASSSAVNCTTNYVLANVPKDTGNCEATVAEMAAIVNDDKVAFTITGYPGMAFNMSYWFSAGSFVDPANGFVLEGMAAINGAVRGIMKNVTVVRSLNPAPTDATIWNRIFGIPTIGFEPVRMPDDVNFMDLPHSSIEALPVAGVKESFRVVFDVIARLSHVH